MIDLIRIQEYLTDYGWNFEAIDSQNLITGWTSEGGLTFPLTIQVMSPWLRLQIPTFAALPNPDNRLAAFEKALKINSKISSARIGISNLNYFTLSADHYIENGLEYSVFEVNLDLLCYTAELLYPEFADL